MHIPLTLLVKLLIDEAKMVSSFTTLFEELASTAEELLPVITEIESLQDVGELNNLKDIIDEVRELVRKCSKVKSWDVFSQALNVRGIVIINEKLFKFCQFQLQLIMLRNQLRSMVTLEATKACMDQQPISNKESGQLGAVIASAGAVVFNLLGAVLSNKLNWSHEHFKVSKLEVTTVAGTVVSDLMKRVMDEAKKIYSFKAVSKELASTMGELLPIITEIESLQGVEELKNLKDTIEKAHVLVQECSKVGSWDIFSKAQYTERIMKINEKMIKFCQFQLQLILLRNQLKSTVIIKSCESNQKLKLIKSCESNHKFKLALLGLACLIYLLIQETRVQACLVNSIAYGNMLIWFVVKACLEWRI